MKRIVSIVLSFASILTIAVPAFAEELPDEAEPDRCCAEQETTEQFFAEEYPLENLSAVQYPETSSTVSSAYSEENNSINNPNRVSEEDSIITDTVVAIMYLCVSGPHAPYFFGHTWICIKNISDEAITVGSRTLEPGEMMSAGLHHDGGMHYDDEIHDYEGDTVQAREYELTRDELRTAEKEITNSRWHWYEYFAHNCTNFATTVWNKVTGQHYFAFCFPFIVQIQMAGNGLERIVMGSH